MKIHYILVIFSLLIFSCQDSTNNSAAVQAASNKPDSLKEIYRGWCNEFFDLVERETNTSKDSVLVEPFLSLLGNDKFMDILIMERISSIKKEMSGNQNNEAIQGEYFIKPIFRNSYPNITHIKIENDSIFLYENKIILFKDKFQLTSINKDQVLGKAIVGQYFLSFVKPNILFLRDNLCMDCEEISFMKR